MIQIILFNRDPELLYKQNRKALQASADFPEALFEIIQA